MKMSLRVLAILLAGLFVVSLIGCGQDTDDANDGDDTVINIPDAALRAEIAKELEIPDDTPITVDDMLKLTYFSSKYVKLISSTDVDIINLTGLEYATNLEELDLSDNAIVNVSPLKELINLTDLNLSFNVIVDVSPLKELTNLTGLLLSRNAIVDVSPLKELTNLKWLFLEDNAIVDVSPLTELTNLKGLYLSGNPLSQDSIRIHIPAIEANGTIVVNEW